MEVEVTTTGDGFTRAEREGKATFSVKGGEYKYNHNPNRGFIGGRAGGAYPAALGGVTFRSRIRTRNE